MLMVAICETMGWDYFQYLEQPSWFVDLIIEKMSIDAKKAKEDERKQKMNRPSKSGRGR